MNPKQPSRSLDFEVIHYPCPPSNSNHLGIPDLLTKSKDLICTAGFVKSLTLAYPTRNLESLKKLRVNYADLKDASIVVKNVPLTSLANLDFVLDYIVPKNVSIFNVYDTLSSRINFLITAAGTLYLSLDLEVFRTLGLSNCKIVNRNGDESVTLEINLVDPLYTNSGSKLYDRLQLALSKISPTSVIVCSEKANALDPSELTHLLSKTTKGFVVCQCDAAVHHREVPLSNEYSLKFLSENVELLSEEAMNGLMASGKTKKSVPNTPDLNTKFEKLSEHREILVKVFNTLKKGTSKSGRVIKDLIHELNQKNVHDGFQHRKEENNIAVSNVLKFLDHLSVQSLKFENGDAQGLDVFDHVRVKNGIISREFAFKMFKHACANVLKESGIFVMSLYTINEKKLYWESPLQGPQPGGFLHIVCSKRPEDNQIATVFIKSK